MEAPKEKEQNGKCYGITLLRLGKAVVMAKSQNEAAQKAICLEDSEIHWLSEADGIPGGRLVSLIELPEEVR